MAEAFATQMESPEAATLSFEERLGLLVDAEWTHRRNTMLARLLREAKLRLPACPEDVEFGAARGLDRSVWRALFAGDFAARHQNVLIVGPTGVGKTYLACALGQALCRHGMRVRYVRLGALLQDAALGRLDGSYGTLFARLAKTDLLILDDFGLAPLAGAEARELLKSSMIATRDARPWSARSCRSRSGTGPSPIRRLLTPFLIASCTEPISSLWRVSQCARRREVLSPKRPGKKLHSRD